MFARCVQNTNAATSVTVISSGRPPVPRTATAITSTTAEISDPSDTYPDAATTAANASIATSIGNGASARNTPDAVATPFPPPLPSRKIGFTCPAIAATPYAMAQPICVVPSAAGSIATGRNPFSRSATYTVRPIFHPSVRNTLVAPRLPLPTVRRSTPLALPARYADGMEPTM